jgi:hypothetical protein
MEASMKRTWIVAAAALAAGGLSGAAQANILMNGSFESGLANWTTTGFIAQDFDFGIDNTSLNGMNAFYGGGIGEPGFLNQLLSTRPGQSYSVELWVLSDGFLPNQLQVLADGELLLQLDDLMAPSSYTRYRAVFSASDATTELQFGLRNDSGFLHLDNLSVQTIPVPETSLLLSLGLAGLAAVNRRTKQPS